MPRPVVAQVSTEVLRFAQDDRVWGLRNLIERLFQEGIMQVMITFMAVVAGLIFSVAVALLAEEFIFGQVFRLFFVQQPIPQTVPLKTGQKR
jgi:hypothetical protein